MPNHAYRQFHRQSQISPIYDLWDDHKAILDAISLVASNFAPDPWATEWYVSGAGNDANDGRTPLTPFLTLAHAVSVAAERDAIYVQRGYNYNCASVNPGDPRGLYIDKGVAIYMEGLIEWAEVMGGSELDSSPSSANLYTSVPPLQIAIANVVAIAAHPVTGRPQIQITLVAPHGLYNPGPPVAKYIPCVVSITGTTSGQYDGHYPVVDVPNATDIVIEKPLGVPPQNAGLLTINSAVVTLANGITQPKILGGHIQGYISGTPGFLGNVGVVAEDSPITTIGASVEYQDFGAFLSARLGYTTSTFLNSRFAINFADVYTIYNVAGFGPAVGYGQSWSHKSTFTLPVGGGTGLSCRVGEGSQFERCRWTKEWNANNPAPTQFTAVEALPSRAFPTSVHRCTCEYSRLLNDLSLTDGGVYPTTIVDEQDISTNTTYDLGRVYPPGDENLFVCSAGEIMLSNVVVQVPVAPTPAGLVGIEVFVWDAAGAGPTHSVITQAQGAVGNLVAGAQMTWSSGLGPILMRPTDRLVIRRIGGNSATPCPLKVRATYGQVEQRGGHL